MAGDAYEQAIRDAIAAIEALEAGYTHVSQARLGKTPDAISKRRALAALRRLGEDGDRGEPMKRGVYTGNQNPAGNPSVSHPRRLGEDSDQAEGYGLAGKDWPEYISEDSDQP